VVSASFSQVRLAVTHSWTPFLDRRGGDTTILLAARLPRRQAKPRAHIIFALDRVVAGEAVHEEAARRGGRQADAERAVLRAMMRPWRQHPPAGYLPPYCQGHPRNIYLAPIP